MNGSSETYTCTQCGQVAREAEGYLAVPDDTVLAGLSLVVFPAEGFGADVRREYGVCSIACCQRRLGELLAVRRGVRRAAHLAPDGPEAA